MMDNRPSDNNHRNNRERISPHSSHSSNDYYQDNQNGNVGGNIMKSDSPSRKRRRLQRMPSQSPPTIWETNAGINSNPMQIQNQSNGYHHNQNLNNRRMPMARQYHNNNQQHSPPIRRQRYRDQPPPPPLQQQQQQAPRPWDINPIFQPSPPHHSHHHAPQQTLMVEMNQVPVSLPLGHHEQAIWTYPAPHISICKCQAIS